MAAATREDVDEAAEALRRAPELDRLLLAPEEVVCLDGLVLRRWDGGRPPGAPLQHQQRLPLSAPLELGRQRQRRHRPAEAGADHNRRVVGSRLGHWYLPSGMARPANAVVPSPARSRADHRRSVNPAEQVITLSGYAPMKPVRRVAGRGSRRRA